LRRGGKGDWEGRKKRIPFIHLGVRIFVTPLAKGREGSK